MESQPVFELVGAALATFHAGSRRSASVLEPRLPDRIERRVFPLATRLLSGHPDPAAALRVRSIEDGGPHNTVILADGTVRFIDLPSTRVDVPVEKDIAQLAQRTVGAAHRYGGSRYWPRLWWYVRAVERLRDGYEHSPDGSPIDLSSTYAHMTGIALMRLSSIRRRRPSGQRLEEASRKVLCAVGFAALALRHRIARR